MPRQMKEKTLQEALDINQEHVPKGCSETRFQKAIAKLLIGKDSDEAWNMASEDQGDKTPRFIRQLKWIDASVDECLQAVADGFMAKSERMKWGRQGIDPEEVASYLDEIEAGYTGARSGKSIPPVDDDASCRQVGAAIYSESKAAASRALLNGAAPKRNGVGRGVLHQFSNGERNVGWHPYWHEKLKGEA